MRRIYLGIGTNLGNREGNLESAVEQVKKIIGPVIKSSSIYETEPWGFTSENEFLNIVIEVDTHLNPSGLLGRLLMIESHMGRLRQGIPRILSATPEKSGKYSSRIIDMDILFYGKRIINKQALYVPHPLLHERKFVLVPLYEIAPNFIHPVLKKNIQTLLEECDDKSRVKIYVS